MQASVSHAKPLPSAGDEEQLASLLRSVAGRDAQALARFYDLSLGCVYGLILRVVRNPADAEEVVSDLYLQVWDKAAEYCRERGSVLAWLKTLAWSRAVDRQRKCSRHAGEVELHPEAVEDAYTECEGLSVEQTAEAWSSARAVQATFATLSDIQRQVLTLAFHQDMSHQDIATLTRLPLGTVKSHVRRGLASLRQALLAGGFAHD